MLHQSIIGTSLSGLDINVCPMSGTS